MEEKIKTMKLILDDPGNCSECPCISGYGRRCMAADRAFDKKDYSGYLTAYPEAYKPDWCPLVEVDDGSDR